MTTSVFNPTDALKSEIEIVPSSTRSPFGSLTVITFASIASANNGSCPVIVTLVGETETVEPLMGDVLTKVLAPAEYALKERELKERSIASAENRTLTFVISTSSQLLRMRHLKAPQFAPIVSFLYN